MATITRDYMGAFEDAAEYFHQNGNRAELAFRWLVDGARQYVAFAGAGDGVVFQVDGWMRIFAMDADTYLVSCSPWITAITRNAELARNLSAGGADGKLLDSRQWEMLEAKFSGLALVDGPCPFGGVPPISARKQAVLAAFSDTACDNISFVPLTSYAAREICRRHHNGIEKGSESSWRGDLISTEVDGKWYIARCLEY